MRESAADKAVRLIAEHRVRVTKANERGIALEVTGDSGDYRVLRFVNRAAAVEESCTCPSPTRNCSHIIAARLLWRP